MSGSCKTHKGRADNTGSAIAASPLYIAYHVFLVGFTSCALGCVHLLWMHFSGDLHVIQQTLEASSLLVLLPMPMLFIFTSYCYYRALHLIVGVSLRFPSTLNYWVFYRLATAEDRVCIPVQSITVLVKASRREMFLDETFRDFFERCEVNTVGYSPGESNGKLFRWCQTPIDCNLQAYSNLCLYAQEDLDFCKLRGGAGSKSDTPSKGNRTKPKSTPCA
jgi:hypothetical protein